MLRLTNDANTPQKLRPKWAFDPIFGNCNMPRAKVGLQLPYGSTRKQNDFIKVVKNVDKGLCVCENDIATVLSPTRCHVDVLLLQDRVEREFNFARPRKRLQYRHVTPAKL